MNRSVRVLLVAAVAAALAGCATTTAGNGTPAAARTAAGTAAGTASGQPTTLPLPSGSTTATAPVPTGTGDAGKTAKLGSVTIPLTGVANVSREDEYLCITLINATGCSLEVIDIGRTRAAGGSVSNPAPGEPNGWWWGSDVASCGDATTASPVTTSTVVEKGFKKVGPKNAAYAHWQVSCQNPDLDFDPRVWWLPTSQIAFRERSTVAGSGEAVDRILAGVTFG